MKMSTYEISKSSLLSLKAEILRKQEEVNKEKLLNKAKAAQGIKKGSPLDLKNKGVNERQNNDTPEDDDLLKKSRSALEVKALLYERLSKGGTDRETDARYLVQFRKKNNDLPPSDSEEEDYDRHPESEEERHFSDEYDAPTNPDEEWVDYVDCLGRTRKCMRKDLPYLQERDSDLKSKRRGGHDDNKDETKEEDEKPANHKEKDLDFDENSELLSNDMRTELLRRKWEKQEEELKNKSDLHYQDILFDEARVHGVGYYGFSKNENIRAWQQESLKKLREETEREQRKAEELRQMRDKQLANRIRAAKTRKRVRLGLPPEEEDDEKDQNSAEKPPEEPVAKEKTAEEIAMEKEKESLRKRHIRPWDYGKEGVKEHVEYTQEDWMYKQRKERNKEFAPPSSYRNERKSDFVDTLKPPPKINNPRKTKVNPYKRDERGHHRESKPYKSKLIVDECVDFDDEQDELLKDYLGGKEETRRRTGSVEIAPPPTFDYYGPGDGKRKRVVTKKVPIEDSISAGLQFLRRQAEKKGNGSNRDADMFLM